MGPTKEWIDKWDEMLLRCGRNDRIPPAASFCGDDFHLVIPSLEIPDAYKNQLHWDLEQIGWILSFSGKQ